MLRLKAWLLLWRGAVGAAEQPLNQTKERIAARRPGPQYTLHIARTPNSPSPGANRLGPLTEIDEALAASPGLPGYDLPLLATRAWALEASGRLEEDRVPSGEAERLRKHMDQIGDWGLAPVWRAVLEAHLAGIKGYSPAAWQRVLDVVTATEGPAHLLPYAGYRLGEALIAVGDRVGATETSRHAADRAEKLGAGLVRGWIDDLSRRTRMPLLSRVASAPDRPSHRPGLTEREHEVLRLVAAGRSNKQIGEALFISAKTASVHWSNILTKLGVPGRGEAAAVAHRARLFDDPDNQVPPAPVSGRARTAP